MNSENNKALLREIPSVERLLQGPALTKAADSFPRNLILKAINQVLERVRSSILEGKKISLSDLEADSLSNVILGKLEQINRSSLRPVINATGIVVHTNLGRSALGDKVLKKFRALSGGYCNLEYDLEAAGRGSRYSHVEDLLCELTSAEAAMVVNNNAAAVLVALETFARDREVIVSRGQLVEIGGSFRIPDVMRKSGAKMVEVGTTNKTHLKDYEQKIDSETALLLKVHRSNFQIVGFSKDVETGELAGLGRKYGIPVLEDLGSGCLIDFSQYGLEKEPTVQDTLKSGADIVTFSGDKMLGGPQAGIIIGRKELVDSIKQNQLSRALRIDKLTLMALEETLRLYRDERAAVKEIPTLKMITMPYKSLSNKGDRFFKTLGKLSSQNFGIELIDGVSKVGGGALPMMELKSRLLSITPKKLSAHDMEEWLRAYNPPIIVRIEKEKVLLDLRTIREKELKTVAESIKAMSAI